VEIGPAHHPGRFGLDQLKLVDDKPLVAKTCFACRKVEFPYPGKAFIIEAKDVLPVAQEVFTPGSERFGVMQKQDLNIADGKRGCFHGKGEFGNILINLTGLLPF
jgi:hypothetical protein